MAARAGRPRPDLVVNTGDNLAHRDSVPVVRDALGELLDVPGVFVFGSNDYYSPTLRNPLRYLLPDDGKRNTHTPDAAVARAGATRSATRAGSTSPTAATRSTVGDTTFAFAGVDDPHLELRPARRGRRAGRPGRRRTPRRSRTRRTCGCWTSSPPTATTRSSPATPTAARCACPYVGALTTNCDLEPARAKGLHRHPADSRDGDPGSSWLHVSAGLGTSPYARIRVACRPEATLMTLVPRA